MTARSRPDWPVCRLPRNRHPHAASTVHHHDHELGCIDGAPGGLHITQLPASALEAQSVSLLKFDLRPASALQIVDDDG